MCEQPAFIKLFILISLNHKEHILFVCSSRQQHHHRTNTARKHINITPTHSPMAININGVILSSHSVWSIFYTLHTPHNGPLVGSVSDYYTVTLVSTTSPSPASCASRYCQYLNKGYHNQRTYFANSSSSTLLWEFFF